jgi:hypothetical protein
MKVVYRLTLIAAASLLTAFATAQSWHWSVTTSETNPYCGHIVSITGSPLDKTLQITTALGADETGDFGRLTLSDNDGHGVTTPLIGIPGVWGNGINNGMYLAPGGTVYTVTLITESFFNYPNTWTGTYY